MFRKLNQLFQSSAQQEVETLRGMGFSESDSRAALSQTGGNVEQAANLLLSRGAPTSAAPAHQFNSQQVEDDDLQRALQESLAVNNNSPKRQPQRRDMRSAAAVKAGTAALNRVGTGSSSKSPKSSRSSSPISSHPNVKVPTKMSEKSKEVSWKKINADFHTCDTPTHNFLFR